MLLFSFSHSFIILFFIKQAIYEIQEAKQIIPEIISLCSMYIHTFAKNKVDVKIKMKTLIILYKVILSQIIF